MRHSCGLARRSPRLPAQQRGRPATIWSISRSYQHPTKRDRPIASGKSGSRNRARPRRAVRQPAAWAVAGAGAGASGSTAAGQTRRSTPLFWFRSSASRSSNRGLHHTVGFLLRVPAATSLFDVPSLALKRCCTSCCCPALLGFASARHAAASIAARAATSTARCWATTTPKRRASCSVSGIAMLAYLVYMVTQHTHQLRRNWRSMFRCCLRHHPLHPLRHRTPTSSTAPPHRRPRSRSVADLVLRYVVVVHRHRLLSRPDNGSPQRHSVCRGRSGPATPPGADRVVVVALLGRAPAAHAPSRWGASFCRHCRDRRTAAGRLREEHAGQWLRSSG